MVSDRIVVGDGPFRYVRNPLYLGTLLHSVAVAFLMRPEAAILVHGAADGTAAAPDRAARNHILTERQGAALPGVPGQCAANYCHHLRPRVGTGAACVPTGSSGVLSEVYMLGTALTLVIVGWSQGVCLGKLRAGRHSRHQSFRWAFPS